MARDPRKNGAFDSGLRGREKPKVQAAHGGTYGQEASGVGGGESKQGASTIVGTPDGVKLNDSAYSSGMRGVEKAKQKTAGGDPRSRSNATMASEEGSARQPENKQSPNSVVGQPSGEPSWSGADRGPKKGINDSHIKSVAESAHDMGAAGSNDSTEHAAGQSHPMGDPGILGEEDDTHINLRIPKASLKRKNPGLQTN